MSKSELGQFYTRNAAYILQDLLDIFPTGATVVDPFAGEHDLLDYLDSRRSVEIEAYDIDPKRPETIKQDSFINSISYADKWVLTNPPYLAKNKTRNKQVFNEYCVGDLYKAAFRMMSGYDINTKSYRPEHGCDGGVVVVPLNFFCDEDNEVRREFLLNYTVRHVNVFEEQVFSDTSYTVCSFGFHRSHERHLRQLIEVRFFPSQEVQYLTLRENRGFRIGDEFYELLEKGCTARIGRLLKGGKPSGNLYLRAIDTGSADGRIGLSVKDHHYGKESDRTFATITVEPRLSVGEELVVVDEFNRILEIYREKCRSLFLTNFRNSTAEYARKRISFEMAYQLISYVIRHKIVEPDVADWRARNAGDTLIF